MIPEAGASRGTLLEWAAALLAFGAEAFAALLAAQAATGASTGPAAGALHLLAAALSTVGTVRQRAAGFLIAFTLPLAGPAIRISDLAARARPAAARESDWYRAFLETVTGGLPEGRLPSLPRHWQRGELEGSWRVPTALMIAPVASLLSDSAVGPELKLAAVRNVVHLKPADAVPLLNAALRSPEPSIRYYAAKLLGNLEDAFTRRLKDAGYEGPLPTEAEKLEPLAQAHLDLANSGLLDPGAARRHRELAVTALEPAAAARGLSEAGRLAFARALLDLGQARHALEVAGELLGRRRGPEAYRVALEACLAQGHHLAFRRLTQALVRAHPSCEWGKELAERIPPPQTSA